MTGLSFASTRLCKHGLIPAHVPSKSGVQFHPESAGGPLDTIAMFDSFLDECAASKMVLSGGAVGGIPEARKGAPAMMQPPSAL